MKYFTNLYNLFLQMTKGVTTYKMTSLVMSNIVWGRMRVQLYYMTNIIFVVKVFR